MEASIARLREALGELLQYYPLVLRNVFHNASSCYTTAEGEPAVQPGVAERSPSTSSAHDANHMADAVEGFLTELTRTLSIGLRDGSGFELWSVLELLECVPDRMHAEAEAEEACATRTRTPTVRTVADSPTAVSRRSSALARSPASLHSHPARSVLTSPAASSSSALAGHRGGSDDDASPWWRHLQRYHFASQLVYLVRSTFPTAPRPLQARILLRLALNQGCLLAALELLRRWCRTELEGFYEVIPSAILQQPGVPPVAAVMKGPGASHTDAALLVQPDTDSDVWNSFVAAIAPVGGPPVAEIAAGAPKTTSQPFYLQLVVAGLDDDSAASLEYYTQLQSYLRGRRPTRPSALMCVEASQRRHTGNAGRALTAVGEGAVGAAATRHVVPVAAQQHVLYVEALPVSRAAITTAAASTTAFSSPQGDGVQVMKAGDANTRSTGHSRITRQRCRRHCTKGTRTLAVGGDETTSAAATEDKTEEGDNAKDGSAGDRDADSVTGRSSTASRGSYLISRCSSVSASASAVPHPRGRRHRSHQKRTTEAPRASAGGPDVADGRADEWPAAGTSNPASLAGDAAGAVDTYTSAVKGSVPCETAGDGAATRSSRSDSEEDHTARNDDRGTDTSRQQQLQPQRQSDVIFLCSDASMTTTAVYVDDTPSLERSLLSSERRREHLQQREPSPARDILSGEAHTGSVDAAVEPAKCDSALPPELESLQARVLQCWAVAVAHAASRERKRLSECDVDANAAATAE